MTTDLAVALASVFVATSLLVAAAASWVMAWRAPERRRVRALARPSSVLAIDDRLVAAAPDPLLARLSRMTPKSPKDMSRLGRRLTRAGLTGPNAVIWYALAEVALPCVMFVLVILVFGVVNGIIPALFMAVVGYVAPSFYVASRTKKRQKAIRNGLPDALDLLTVCVEAGSGLDQAISHTGEELHISHPGLAEELRLITTEIRAGKPRPEALQNFAARTGVDDVRSLVAMLVQTDRFGTSIGDALRVHSDTSRTKRRQAAEERAGKIGVKLVFPLVLCLFPALYVVCFGPVVVSIYRAFFNGQ